MTRLVGLLLVTLVPLVAVAGPDYVPTDGVWNVKVKYVSTIDRTCVQDLGGNELACIDNPTEDAGCAGKDEAGLVHPCYFIPIQRPLGADLEIVATNERSGIKSAPSAVARLLSLFPPEFLSWLMNLGNADDG